MLQPHLPRPSVKTTQSSYTPTHTSNILRCLRTIFHIFLSPLVQDEITFRFGQIGEQIEADSEDERSPDAPLPQLNVPQSLGRVR